MSIDFRCEHCGKLLSVDAEAGSETKCTHCGKKVTVPAALAALPRPHVQPNAAPPPLPPATATVDLAPEEVPAQHDALGVMSKLMPWVISVFFHLGVVMIMAFATMLATGINKTEAPEQIIPSAELSDDPGGSLTGGKTDFTDTDSSSTITRSDFLRKETVMDTGNTGQKSHLAVAGGTPGGGSTGKGDLGLKTTGGGGPRSNMYGHGGNCYHVVYVIDRSGSMLETFDYVRRELLKSISNLKAVQDFHVIFFADNKPQEIQYGALVPATDEYKANAADFVDKITTEGQTDPVPAIKRAFEVLGQADETKKGKLIYLLTDGVFPDNQKVLDKIKEYNSKKDVMITTFLFNSDNAKAIEVLQKIASENGGHFRTVNPDE